MAIRRGMAGRDVLADSLAAIFLWGRVAAGRITAERRRGLRPIPILNFHRISTLRPEHEGTLDPTRFRHVLSRLKERRRFVSLAELDAILARGSNVEDVVALTFDDSYGCNYRHAIPILKDLGIPATFFVASGFVDTSEPFAHDVRQGIRDLPNFTSSQLAEMAGDPLFEIGSHSVSHCDFSGALMPSTVAAEVANSRKALEDMCGTPVVRFAVPWGAPRHCARRMIDAGRDAGYVRLYSHFGGRNLVSPDGTIGYILHRICTHGTPLYVNACLEGYRGRSSFIPGSSHQSGWPVEFHPTDIRRI